MSTSDIWEHQTPKNWNILSWHNLVMYVLTKGNTLKKNEDHLPDITQCAHTSGNINHFVTGMADKLSLMA